MAEKIHGYHAAHAVADQMHTLLLQISERLRQALTGKAYKIRRIAINTGGGLAQPRPMFRVAAASAADVITPQLEGGLSTITVSVSGAVEV